MKACWKKIRGLSVLAALLLYAGCLAAERLGVAVARPVLGFLADSGSLPA